MQKENWFPIKGFEGNYVVSDMGNVKSIERFVKHSKGGLQILRERILKPAICLKYKTVYLSKDGVQKTFYVHTLVCSIRGERPKGLVIDHINGDSFDNRLTNLRYCTQRENLNNMSVGNLATGVTLTNNKKGFRARIRINGKLMNLGSFHTEQEASNAYLKKKKQLENKQQYHGESNNNSVI